MDSFFYMLYLKENERTKCDTFYMPDQVFTKKKDSMRICKFYEECVRDCGNPTESRKNTPGYEGMKNGLYNFYFYHINSN